MRAWAILLASQRAFLPQLPRPLERAAIRGARAPALLVAEEFDRAFERPVAYQEIVLGPYLADLEHRRARPQERAHVIDRPQLRARDTERDHRRRVAVHDRHHFGPRAIDLAMNVAFDESLPALSWKRF